MGKEQILRDREFRRLKTSMDTSDFSAVAFSGSYTDLINQPLIPAAQVNSDWNSVSGVSRILNKPTIPAAQVNSDWAAVSGVTSILNKPTLFSGAYADLTGKPTIPAAQVNSDWNAVSGVAQILNKPTIPTVKKVLYFTGTTNASGVWTIPITGFTTVDWVSALSLNAASTAAGTRWATITSFNTTSATGTVAVGNTIVSLLGLLGIALVGAGVAVSIRVEGT